MQKISSIILMFLLSITLFACNESSQTSDADGVLKFRLNGNTIQWSDSNELKWETSIQVDDLSDYVLVLKLNEGLINDSDSDVEIAFKPGDAIELPIPTRNGYTFLGWDNETFYEGIDVKSLTINALWEKTKYQIFLHTGIEDEIIEPIEVSHGDSINLPSVEIEGYTFNGWYESEYYWKPFSMNIMPEEDIHVYGQYTKDPSPFDFNNILYDADFSVEVTDNIYWRPASSLRKPNSSAEDILALLDDPQGLQAEIDNLYEVLYYLYLVDFKASSDNIRIFEDGVNWEHHKPGEMAILTNNGCCATVSNLLNYLLKDDYDEVGFISYSQSDGSGHVFNYIKHLGDYYFVDLTHYLNDYDNKAMETGQLSSYINSDYVAGNIHQVESVEDYIDYILDSYNNPPEIFSMYQALNVLPIDALRSVEFVEVVYPTEYWGIINIVYDPTGDSISYGHRKGPTIFPDEWEPYNIFIDE